MRARRAHSDRGLSLMEILVSLAIVTLVMGGATLGLRSLVKSELRATAGKLAAAVRFSYDKAIATGSVFRLHFNLDDQTYKLERAEGRFVMGRGKEQAGRGGRGLDLAEEAEREEEDEKRRTGTAGGVEGELLPPPPPKRAKFSEFQDTSLKEVRLKGVRVIDLYTPRQEEAYTAGHAYLHFFPDGHTERAVIHVGSDNKDVDDQYTLVVHGLTGRVEVKPGRYDPPGWFDSRDDDGNKRIEP